ncbi:hypothetical protein LDENG_00074900, partial [Lucifuga dentata]
MITSRSCSFRGLFIFKIKTTKRSQYILWRATYVLQSTLGSRVQPNTPPLQYHSRHFTEPALINQHIK